MSWDCPHQNKGECVRLNKVCLPLQKGCVLEEKVKLVGDQLHQREEDDLKVKLIKDSKLS